MRIDIMTDIETLGKGDSPCVFQIAACAFDIETGKTLSTFNELANIESVKNIEGGTLLWWLNTNKELLTELLTRGQVKGDTELVLIQDFVKWYNLLNTTKSEKFLWGNGILFDNRIIKNKCSQYNIEYPVFYRNDRDMRTVVELAALREGIATEKEFRDKYRPSELVEHDGLDDVKAQIHCLCKACEILNK